MRPGAYLGPRQRTGQQGPPRVSKDLQRVEGPLQEPHGLAGAFKGKKKKGPPRPFTVSGAQGLQGPPGVFRDLHIRALQEFSRGLRNLHRACRMFRNRGASTSKVSTSLQPQGASSLSGPACAGPQGPSGAGASFRGFRFQEPPGASRVCRGLQGPQRTSSRGLQGPPGASRGFQGPPGPGASFKGKGFPPKILG